MSLNRAITGLEVKSLTVRKAKDTVANMSSISDGKREVCNLRVYQLQD